jgi:YbgC/YbaW family acyl-CoA thioester hydrolase
MPLSEYRLRRRVQFYETDVAGMVHFSWFFRYMEEAEHALWREAGLSIHPPDADVGWPRIAAAFEFHRALRFEDEFDVWLHIAKMTKKTIRYACVLTKGGERIATGTMTIACVRKQPTMQGIEIPVEITKRLAPAATPSRGHAKAPAARARRASLRAPQRERAGVGPRER